MGYSDSATGYTYEFYVYTKKNKWSLPKWFWLSRSDETNVAYVEPRALLFFDKIYTSVTLLVDLYAQNTPACDRET